MHTIFALLVTMFLAQPAFGFHQGAVNPDPKKDPIHEVNSECQMINQSNVATVQVVCRLGVTAIVDVSNIKEFCLIGVLHEHGNNEFHGWIDEVFVETGNCEGKTFVEALSIKGLDDLLVHGMKERYDSRGIRTPPPPSLLPRDFEATRPIHLPVLPNRPAEPQRKPHPWDQT